MDAATRDLIEVCALKYGLQPDIVYGVVMTESAGNPFAARFEKNWHYFVDPARVRPSGCSVDTETDLQKFSYGLMQVMGSVFREHGYKGWLTAILARPDLQLDYGCKHLARFIKKYGFEGGISAFNNGQPDRNHDGQIDNPTYVKSVLDNAKAWGG